MKFSEMPYRRPDKEEILQRMDNALASLKKAVSADQAIRAMKEMEQIVIDVDTMGTICHIRNTVDTTDHFYQAEREYNDQLSPHSQRKNSSF